MTQFDVSSADARLEEVGNERTKIIRISNFFNHPETVVDVAASQRYARINPHYPGVRAAISPDLLAGLCQTVADVAHTHLGQPTRSWMGQAWYSIVTNSAEQLTPIQRLPHFDGFDETQMAIMIYLNQTDHGGTAFYRHKTTGYESVTEARYPVYKSSLEADVQASGLPPAQYISDGAPVFEKIAESDAAFNSLIVYPGTALHSGVIDNDVPLSPEPRTGRLTINGFFRPA